MIQKFPKFVFEIKNKFQKGGLEIYLVGGSVRDILMGKIPKDWDFTTNAKPAEIQTMFERSFYDNRFGTVGIPGETFNLEKTQIIEITTFRKESGYSDRRQPDVVKFAQTLKEDLARRDFTINAMALLIDYGLQTTDYSKEIIDPFGGQEDLKNKMIRAVGDPDLRFAEDALRLIRAIRLATQLKFVINQKTFAAIKNNASLIKKISGERIREELFKILSSDFCADGFWLLRNSGILAEILPEVETGFEVEQKTPLRHHIYDVGTHSFKSLEACPSKDPLVRFAALLHDIGKPISVGRDENGTTTFYNHEVIGAHLTRAIAQRLHFSKKEREKLVTLIRWHQFSVDEATTPAAVRRFIRRVGVENIKDMVDVRVADRLGGGLTEATSWRLRRFMEMVKNELHPPFSVTDLAVNGRDVMKILEIPPGPEVGKTLQEIFDEIEEGKEKNDRKALLKRLEQIKKAKR